jgi:imidazole glycerol-phosphate synthase subunit HisF
MLKKRIIFTLLYDNGSFMLSRNFRLQRVGDLNWLQTNYNFSKISFFIDELIVLDVSRNERNSQEFCRTLEALTEGCFVPIAAGGGIRSVEYAKQLLRSGADKVIVNTPLFDQQELIKSLAEEFGQQCVVGSIDIKKTSEGNHLPWTESGTNCVSSCSLDKIFQLGSSYVGEWYLNSIDKDGTGQGYDLSILDLIPTGSLTSVILAGGAGNALHLHEGLSDSRVDAVATAHLFNFVGDGLKQARMKVAENGIVLASWPPKEQIEV